MSFDRIRPSGPRTPPKGRAFMSFEDVFKPEPITLPTSELENFQPSPEVERYPSVFGLPSTCGSDIESEIVTTPDASPIPPARRRALLQSATPDQSPVSKSAHAHIEPCAPLKSMQPPVSAFKIPRKPVFYPPGMSASPRLVSQPGDVFQPAPRVFAPPSSEAPPPAATRLNDDASVDTKPALPLPEILPLRWSRPATATATAPALDFTPASPPSSPPKRPTFDPQLMFSSQLRFNVSAWVRDLMVGAVPEDEARGRTCFDDSDEDDAHLARFPNDDLSRPANDFTTRTSGDAGLHAQDDDLDSNGALRDFRYTARRSLQFVNDSTAPGSYALNGPTYLPSIAESDAASEADVSESAYDGSVSSNEDSWSDAGSDFTIAVLD
ncbi:hypothetical protein HDZ31DRAFT_74661 [Schizophyllum fasciatum]